jgi:hypothetical protein
VGDLGKTFLIMFTLRYVLIALSGVGAYFAGADALITGPMTVSLVISAALILNAMYLLLTEP